MLNGDVITTLDFTELVALHQAEDTALTIATQVRRATIDFGVIQVEDGDAPLQNVTGYLEKPSSEYAVSMGVYVVSPRVLRLIEPGAYLDFPDLVLMASGAGERVASFRYDGLWLDIGRHEDYEQAICAEPGSGHRPQGGGGAQPARGRRRAMSPARRILLINQYAGSPRDGMEFRPHSLAREWQAMGHQTLIVAGSPSHVRAHNPDPARRVSRELVDGVEFEWLRLPRYNGNGARRAANILAFARTA